MAIRYHVDNAGAWFLHCHIQSHLLGGPTKGVDKRGLAADDPTSWAAQGGQNATTTGDREVLALSLQRGCSDEVRLEAAQFGGIYFSDDLSLVKDDGTWRIVNKTYYAHPV